MRQKADSYRWVALVMAAALSVLAPTPEPVTPAPTGWEPPQPAISALASGAGLWVIEEHRLPLVSLRLVIPMGAAQDPENKWGLASLAAAMMTESAGTRDSISVSAELWSLGATLNIGAARDTVWISLDVHADRLEPALAILADALLRPQFTAIDWANVRDLRISGERQNRQDPAYLAVEMVVLVYYAAGDPSSHPLDGTPNTLAAVTLDDVRAWHQRLVDTTGATVVVVGDVTPDAVRAMLDAALVGWLPTTAAPPRVASMPDVAHAGHVFLVDVPGASQTAFRVMGPGYDASGADRAASQMANFLVGGSLNARLNEVMREQRGYTYYVGSVFDEGARGTLLDVATQVDAARTAEALVDLGNVLRAAALGYSSEEVETAHRQVRSAAVIASETRGSLAELFASRATLGRSPTSWLAELEAQEATTGEQLQLATQRYMDPSRLVTVLAGDRTVIEPQLRALGLAFEVLVPPP